MHVLTFVNGRQQGLGIFGTGLAGYEGLQEGLGVFAELAVDGLTPALAPVLHLRRLGSAPMVGGYLATLDHLFATATPSRPVTHLRAVAA